MFNALLFVAIINAQRASQEHIRRINEDYDRAREKARKEEEDKEELSRKK